MERVAMCSRCWRSPSRSTRDEVRRRYKSRLVSARALFKQVLFDSVRAYLSGGPARMTAYDDGERPIRPSDDFIGLLKNSPYIVEQRQE